MDEQLDSKLPHLSRWAHKQEIILYDRDFCEY